MWKQKFWQKINRRIPFLMNEDLSLPYQMDYKHREDETILAHLDDLGVGWCWNEKVRTPLPPSLAAGPLSKSSIWFLIFDETSAFWNNWKEWEKNLKWLKIFPSGQIFCWLGCRLATTERGRGLRISERIKAGVSAQNRGEPPRGRRCRPDTRKHTSSPLF